MKRKRFVSGISRSVMPDEKLNINVGEKKKDNVLCFNGQTNGAKLQSSQLTVLECDLKSYLNNSIPKVTPEKY